MKLPGLPPIRIPLADLARRRAAWSVPDAAPTPGDGRLTEVTAFGANPGQLRMLRYVPPQLAPGAPIVVLLHGCTQRGGAFDLATGWSVLAERHGFTVVVPEQRSGNNHNLCFNWFEAADITRGSGEVASIHAMVASSLAELRADPARVFVTGLSAGGAMAAALLATYPDVFAAGAIIAGLPYRAALSTGEAMGAMYNCPKHSAAEWADRVRHASPSPARKPIVSIWHGDADSTVQPGAATQSAKQWCGVHGLDEDDSSQDTVDGARHRAWRDRRGVTQVELYSIPGLGHGAPITPGSTGDHGVGQAMPYVLEASISSTWHIARSWGLVPSEVIAAKAPAQRTVSPFEMFRQAYKF